MKKLILCVLLGLSLFTIPGFSAEFPQTNNSDRKEVVVYITRTGEKYHQSDCRYLRQSKIQTTKKEAVKNGYSACKVCKP